MASYSSMFGCSCVFCASSIAVARPLVLALGGESDEGFDPVMGWGLYGSPLFQSTLLQRDDDFQLQSDLAETVTVSENGLVWKALLRRDAKFSDGRPVTSNDVVFTFEKARVSGGRNDLTMLSAVKAIDAHTVEFTLAEPSSLFWGRLATLGIVPAAYYDDDNYASQPLGSGPFQMVEWQRGRQLIVKPNPYYYGKKSPFEKITFLFGADESLVMQARRGGVDVVSIPVSLASVPFANMNTLAVPSVDNRGVSFPVNEPFVTGDNRKAGSAVTSDIAIRKAINLVVNRKQLVAGLLDNYGRPAWSLADSLPWGQKNGQFSDNQPDKARDILEQAGWRYDAVQKVRVKHGVPARFELWYTRGDAVRQGLALAFANMVRPLGIDINVKSGSWEAVKKSCIVSRYCLAGEAVTLWSCICNTPATPGAKAFIIRVIMPMTGLINGLRKQWRRGRKQKPGPIFKRSSGMVSRV